MTAEPDIIPEEPGPAHFEIAKTAARVLGTIADGNGMTADQLRVARHETIVQKVAGDVLVEIQPEMAHLQLKGKQPRGQVVGSKASAIADAKAAAEKFLGVERVQKEIIETLHKRPGRGFGEKAFKFKIAQQKQDYSVVDKCNACGGTGSGNCTACGGQGGVDCANCRGNGTIQRDDGSRDMCHTCNGSGDVRCGRCSGSGQIHCGECDHSGYTTHVYNAGWVAVADFVLERQGLPPEALKAIDAIGVQPLAVDGHAEVFRQNAEIKEHKLAVPFLAFLPLSMAEFSINGKTWPGFVAGLKGYVLEIDPFLDSMVKPGIGTLQKLSKGPMAAAALMETACKYRLLRSTLSGLSHHSRKWVYQRITQEYPLVLSDKYARAAIKYAGTALMSLSEGPRRKGLLLGTLLAGGLAAFWFAGGGRAAVAPVMAQNGLSQHMIGADLGVYAACLLMTVLTIKLVAAAGLKKLLPDSLQVRDRGLPPAGSAAGWAVLTVAVVFIATAIASAQKPEWILPLAKIAGLN